MSALLEYIDYCNITFCCVQLLSAQVLLLDALGVYALILHCPEQFKISLKEGRSLTTMVYGDHIVMYNSHCKLYRY